jgi:hypothetical protein
MAPREIPLKRTRPEGCLSDLAIDRLLAQELSPREAREIKTHLLRCLSCRARLEELERCQGRQGPRG